MTRFARDDGVELQEAIKRELKSIIAMAFTHPEALKPTQIQR